ncbi:MAG: RidA family protein [Reyranellaceae bacterium]
MTPLIRYNPPGVMPPVGPYTHGIGIPANARWLYVSGQVGADAAGATPADIAAQSELAWRNLTAVLAAAGMLAADLVKVTTFLLRPEDLPVYAGIRKRYLAGSEPAMTLLFVSALARPEWLVEVEAIAARAER